MRTHIQRPTGGGSRYAPRALGGVVALGLMLGSLAVAPTAQAALVDVGGRTFDVQSATVGQEHYQAAYSERNKVLWVTATTHSWDSGSPRAAVSTISKLNPDTLQVISTITPRTLDAGTPTARPEAAYGIATDDENDRIWTSATREDAVVIYNQTTGARVATIGNVGHSRDIAIDPYRDMAYVSDPNGGTITKISTNTLQVVETISGLGAGFSPMSLDLVADANSALLYTVNLSNGALIELNSISKSYRVVANTGGESASGVAVDRGRGLAYVASQGTADVRTFNLATGQQVNRVAGSAAQLNVAVDSANGLVYSATFGGSNVLVLDAATGARIGEVAVGTSPNDVIVAAGTAYAVDRAAGGSKVWKITPQNSTPTPTPTPTPTTTPTTPAAAQVTIEGNPVIGGTITLKGTGWKHPDGTGSRVALKLDDGAIRKLDGTDVWLVIDAAADGSFSVPFTLPDGTTGAGGSNPAYATGAHVLRFLTGSLKPGDTGRSVKVDVTVGAKPTPTPTTTPTSTPTTTPTATPTATPTSTPTSTPTNTPTATPTATPTSTPTTPTPGAATVTVKGKPTVGGKITLIGKGWKHPDGTGSRIAVKFDDGAIKKTDGTDVWQLIDAKADGTFKVELILPNGRTKGEYGSVPAYTKGDHSLRFLTGALKPGDNRRSEVVAIKVGKALPKPVAKAKPGIWGKAKGHEVLTASTGKWKNAKKATFRYQWLRDGKAIEGATSRKYRLTGADAGALLSVRVEATTPKGAWGVATSASKKVEKANTRLSATVTRQQGDRQARVRVEIGSKDWIKPDGGELTITASGKTTKVKASDYYVRADLPWLRPGMEHKVTITFSGDKALKGSSTSFILKVG